MTLKINRYYKTKTPIFERYTGTNPVPGYDDITQLWVLKNDIRDDVYITIDGKKYHVVREANAGLITDKASTPGNKSDWYPACHAYLWHDIDFTLHNWRQFDIHGDDGFRVANKMFLADIAWHIRDAMKRGIITRWRALWWTVRARLWYRAVNSIAGQGRYVNADPARGNHARYSTTTIIQM